MRPHHFVEARGKIIAYPTPLPHLTKAKASHGQDPGIVVGDRIPHRVELLQLAAPVRVAHIEHIDGISELQPKPVEVRSEVARIRIPRIELAILRKHRSNRVLDPHRRNRLYQEAHAFVVQFSTETLELRREQEHVGIVELLGPPAPAAGRSTDPAVGVLDLIE
jgi:hypothetical protein